MEVGDCSLWHHLVFCEELLNNDGENDVFCKGCGKSVLGCAAYKCLECTFFHHKTCTELSHVNDVIQHPMHPEHTLFLRKPSSSNCCDVCRKYCHNSYFYRCPPCDFDIDIKCVSRWGISADDCHQHALFPTRKQIQFTCEACAEESNDIAYQCSICRVLIHHKCGPFSHTIKVGTHDHFLTRTYFLYQDEQRDNVFCEVCRKKVNTAFAVYYCRKCGYITHVYCANRLKDIENATTDEVDATQLVHLVEGINLTVDERASLQEIKHFSHPKHNLILSNEEPKEKKLCKACMQFVISVPFYNCAQCNFSLHYKCTKLPETIKRGKFHHHSLTLLSQYLDEDSRLFYCEACDRSCHGFRYRCDKCIWYRLDIQCCLIPEIIEHEGHQHSLYLAIRSPETCNGCGKKGVVFRCTNCNKFTLCFRCATLPFVARYEYDTHLLKLSSMREDDSGEYYCLICEKERNYPDHLFYYCIECKFTAHPQCVLEGSEESEESE